MSKIPHYPGRTMKATQPGGGGNKLAPVSLDRNVAQGDVPASTPGDSDNRTFVDTFFTKVPVSGDPPPVIYNGDRTWARVTLELETAGPVAVGNLSSIAPVLSGKGQLLETGVPAVFYIAKGTRLYVAAAGINRIKRVVEPIPWLETITGLVGGVITTLGGVIASARSRI
jgi:hypothetical protein